jgi:ribulose-5-phosphate 4-epimerase/fuculose-1-phosphate aldolase
MTEREQRKKIVFLGNYLSMRGFSPGSSGNISVRLDDGFLMTPTNSTLGRLAPERISRLDSDGGHIGGDKPSKEVGMHLAMYRKRPRIGAVVHLHSPYCMALSCLADLDPKNALPALTPYYVMRIGRLPLIPYFRPGDPALAQAVEQTAGQSHALLFAQHGMLVGSSDLDGAVGAAEELEETARLFLLIKDRPYRTLDRTQIEELERAFPKNI